MADQVSKLPVEDGVEIPPAPIFGRPDGGTFTVDDPQYWRMYKPKTEIGALIRAEFAKRGWKVGDVARILGAHQENVSATINMEPVHWNGQKLFHRRRWGMEAKIAELLGFNPFPPPAAYQKYDAPLAQELFEVTRMFLNEIADRWGVDHARLALVCKGERDLRVEPLIERLLGRKIFDASVKRQVSAKNPILAELQKRGFTLEYIGQECGVTRERVRQVLLGSWGGTTARSPRVEAKVSELLGYDAFPDRGEAPGRGRKPGSLTDEHKAAMKAGRERWMANRPPKIKPAPGEHRRGRSRKDYIVFGLPS